MDAKFAILAILDGWGIAAPGPGNAISRANVANISRYYLSYPHTQLQASGEAVGLPAGEAGNTETGHLNLGAGRIIYQDLARINMSIADGTFFLNENLNKAIEHVKKNNSSLHVMGLLGAGGVHSNMEHLFALIRLAKEKEIKNLYLHLFTDGRDSPPTAAKIYIEKVKEVINREGVGQIASIMGRYWAMDRDQRWERTQKAYRALTLAEGNLVKSESEAIESSYEQGKTDEFIEPSVITKDGRPIATIKENDAVIFFNFRIDRPRQLVRAFSYTDFSQANISTSFDPYSVKYNKKHNLSQDEQKTLVHPTFERGEKIKNLLFVTMTEYEKNLTQEGVLAAFPPEKVDMPLGRVIAEAGFKQLRCSESEKERFVTFYFNGQQELPFELEERLIVSSPKIATYDLKPEMSAIELTDTLLSRLKSGLDYKLVIVNFANADMVGHTGNIGSTVKACEVVDECVARLANFVLAYDGALFITADHGNAEDMINPQTGQASTEHSTNPVPFMIIHKDLMGRSEMLTSGVLADVAPTIISALGLSVPSQMTGRNLMENMNLSKSSY